MNRSASFVNTRAAKAALAVALAGACTLGSGPVLSQAAAPKAEEFSWRAPLDVAAATGWARVSLPADALLRLQSNDARDVRVFNGSGEAVAFAFVSTPQAVATEKRTPSYTGHALFSASEGTRPARGSVRVKMDGTGSSSKSVWVQFDTPSTSGGSARPGAVTPLAAGLFDTRREKQPIKALVLEATMPANTPVQITAATSSDLAQWTPLALNGRLFHFEGAGDMDNQVLELDAPLSLEGRYLRLGWEGQAGVIVTSIAGIVAPTSAPVRTTAPLPDAKNAGPNAVEWALSFATPIRSLALTTTQANSLVPVRVLGRSDTSQPWRMLAQTVVYRLPSASGSDNTNPPVALNASLGASSAGYGAPVRWLRVESTHGLALDASALKAAIEVAPVQLVFLASGGPPFTLAATLPPNIDSLPEARPGVATMTAQAGPAESKRKLLLWGVLGGGVLVLAGVAWALLRQLKNQAPEPQA